MALQSKLHDVTLPDFSGDAKIKYLGNAHYEFHRWGSEVTGQGPGGPERKGGRAPGLARDVSGADGGMVPRRIQREVLGGTWAPSFIHTTNINEDPLAV